MKKTLLSAAALLFLMANAQCTRTISTDGMTAIPLGGNAYITSGHPHRGPRLTDQGLTQWRDDNTISTYFKTSTDGRLDLALRTMSAEGCKVRVLVDGKTFDVELPASSEPTVTPVGSVKLSHPGYVRVDLTGLSKTGDTFADVIDLMVGGPAASDSLNFVRPDFGYYWGRRGPSVHLKYALPQTTDVEYFYNEVTVPEGEDVIGSYYMANGFGEGYFGIQVNSPQERRVLFSVWSPFDTQDPTLIPDDQKIRLIERGEGVTIGEFGNEGSGGQSYLVYPWRAGQTYRFLTRIHPDGKGNTQYTAWFYAPEAEQWRLIASFLRPQTNTWYRGAYSFLENFIPEQGYITRRVEFGNQWARTVDGQWHDVTDATFTYDATANAQVRVDYAGGIAEDGNFYLQNCGFFDDNTPYRSQFTRTAKGEAPGADVEGLVK